MTNQTPTRTIKVLTKVPRDRGDQAFGRRHAFRTRFATALSLAASLVRSKHSERSLNILSVLSFIGVALGVATILIVSSVMNGFDHTFSKTVTDLYGDVLIYSSKNPVLLTDDFYKKLKSIDGVSAIVPSIVSPVMVRSENAEVGGLLEGIDFSQMSKVTRLRETLISGNWPTDRAENPSGLSSQSSSGAVPGATGGEVASDQGEYVLGESLAEKLKVGVGQTFDLLVPYSGDSNLSAQAGSTLGDPLLISGKVVGIVRIGMYKYDSKFVFGGFKYVSKAIQQDGRVTTFRVKAAKGVDLISLRSNFEDLLQYPFRSKTWFEMDPNLHAAIALEKVVISLILGVIMIVAAFNMVNTLFIMVQEKAREVAILKAMGLGPMSLFQIFLILGSMIGILGSTCGLAVGLLISWLIPRMGFIEIPKEIYHVSHLPVLINVREIFMVVAASVMINMLASVIPARRISKLLPVHGLQSDGGS